MDVVVPFHGTPADLEALASRLARLELSSGDTLLIVNNTPARAGVPATVPVLAASERATPGYARNRGAERGSAEWLVFLDADTEPSTDLLNRYFDPPPAADTVLLAGGIEDEAVPADAPGPARYAYLRHTLSQDRSLGREDRFAFAQAANIACRRSAFEAVGGFREDIRAAEDADLSYRLKAAGGSIERRERASVIHHSRRELRAFLAQAWLHGAGSAWLDRNYPGAFPARRRPGLLWWAARTGARGLAHAAVSRDRDALTTGLYEPLWELAFEFGRLRSVRGDAGPPITSRRP